MKRITVWYVQNKDGAWSHNDIEDGWVVNYTRPNTINSHQAAAWKDKKWKPMYAWLVDGVVHEDRFLRGAFMATTVAGVKNYAV